MSTNRSTADFTRVPGVATPARQLLVRAGVSIGVTVLVAITAIVVFATGSSGEPPEAAPGFALTQVQGRTVAVVASTTMEETRLSSIDVVSGEVLFDERIIDERAFSLAVLAAGEGYVYVATDEGLLIRSLEDGAAVAAPDAIDGLGDRYVASVSAYAADLVRGVVVVLDVAGSMLTIPIGATTASPAEADVEADWGAVLAPSGLSPAETVSLTGEAFLPDGSTLVARPTAAGALTEELVRTSAEGTRPLGDATFIDAELVAVSEPPNATATLDQVLCGGAGACDLDAFPPEMIDAVLGSGAMTALGPARAAGADDGYVIVSHRRDANDDATAISTVSLVDGTVIATVEAPEEVGGALTASGTTALVAAPFIPNEPSVLVVANRAGALQTFEIGERGLFGW